MLMQNTATRVWISRELRRKGKPSLLFRGNSFTNICSFGWVNASYVYGLQLVNAHMRRALGTLTQWEDYDRATATIHEDVVGNFAEAVI